MRIVIVGTFRYPYGDAASNRITEFAKALQFGGCQVEVLTLQGRDSLPKENEKGIREGVKFQVLRNSVKSFFGEKIAGLQRFLFSRGLLVNALKKRLSEGVDLVVIYGSSAWLTGGLLRWGNENNIPIVADVVEWYDIHQCAGGYLGPFFYDSEFFMRKISLRLDGVVAISEYLYSYFSDSGVRVHKVPGLASVEVLNESSLGRIDSSELEILYSGFPGKKDVFAPILGAARYFATMNMPVKFTLTGRNLESAILAAGLSLEEVANLPNLNVLGWCSEDELRQVRDRADVAVVLRSTGRSSEANFPQKLAEYIAAGKPVIVNDIGDMAFYVKEAGCGLVIKDATTDSLVEAIKALMLNKHSLVDMKVAAKKCAAENFDYRAVSENLVSFLKDVRTSKLTKS